jgi:hypothetical protein
MAQVHGNGVTICSHQCPPALLSGQDPFNGTVETTLTDAQRAACVHQLLQVNTATADQQLSMGTLMTACVVRGDDARLIFLTEFYESQLLTDIGGCLTAACSIRTCGS